MVHNHLNRGETHPMVCHNDYTEKEDRKLYTEEVCAEGNGSLGDFFLILTGSSLLSFAELLGRQVIATVEAGRLRYGFGHAARR